MKKIFGLLFIVGITLSSCGSSTSVSQPEEVGEQVMDLLKDMDDMSLEDFKEYFISLEEIRDMSKDPDLVKDEEGRNRLSKLTKEEYNEGLSRSFSQLVEKGSELKIKWSEIEFEDFTYEVDTQGGLKSCNGKLLFKYDGNSYQVRTYSVFDGSGYSLANVRSVRKK